MAADKQHLPSEMSATTEVIQPLSVMAYIPVYASHRHHEKTCISGLSLNSKRN